MTMTAQADLSQATIITVVLAVTPVLLSVLIQGWFNTELERRRSEAARELARQQNDFAVAREKRDEQRERENKLWQLEFDKFQQLEAFLNELVHSVHDENADVNALMRRLWLFIEQFSLGFPNIENAGGQIYELEGLYLTARQNLGGDYLLLRGKCEDIVKTFRTGLAVGLPHIVLRDGRAESVTRTGD